MKFSDSKLPSNLMFGFFFSAVFFMFAGYFFYKETFTVAQNLVIVGLVFFVITLIKADLLLPFNKLWMRFGYLLGMIISPIVMSVIFFGLITPYGFVMRVAGRDELRLKQNKKESKWIIRSQSLPQTDFKKQF